MSHNRHNFSAKIISTLRQRVNNRCSNPSCRVPTTGPVSDPEKFNVIGEAAHITAAAPGGPRFDPSLSRQERSSIRNAIWLCSNCSDKIDKDVARYTVTILEGWKKCAEQLAEAELGRQLPSDADLQLFKNIALGSLPRTSIAEAVSRVAATVKHDMEKLDPRFDVSVLYREGHTEFTLSAKEPVHLRAEIEVPTKCDLEAQLVALIEHGDPVTIDAQRIRFEGSALFEAYNDQPATLWIISNAVKSGVQKVALIDARTKECMPIDDFHGEITEGTKSFTFRGATYAGLLGLEYRVLLSSANQPRIVEVSFDIRTSIWEGKNVSALPYLDKALLFFEKLANGSCVEFRLEIDGNHAFAARSVQLEQNRDIFFIYRMLKYIRNVRELARFLSLEITLKKYIKISAEDFDWLNILYHLIFQVKEDAAAKINSLSMRVVPKSAEHLRELEKSLKSCEPQAMRIDQQFERPVNLLGTELSLPCLTFIYSKVRLRPKSKGIRPKIRKPIEVETLPADGCALTVYRTETVRADT